MSDKKDKSEISYEELAKEFEHKYKLALADYQNLLKQTAKERVDLALYANESMILEMIPVYDNLKLTLDHYPENGDKNWLTGLQHVIQQFKKVLLENGVAEIETNNQKFDHNLMEAVETVETEDDKLEDMVAKELKAGYMLHKKVIIPARVAVYKFNSPHPA